MTPSHAPIPAEPRDATPQDDETRWHALTEQELWSRLGSGEGGLRSSEIPHRLAAHGPNALTVVEPVSLWTVLAHQLHDPLIYLLIAAALLSALTGHAVDALVIGAVILLNTLLGAVQEWKADRALEALRNLALPNARVLRDGAIVSVSSEGIVPGDLLVLETGDRVAADARVLTSIDLQCDESALTGESEAVFKTPAVLAEDRVLGDRSNMVWSSCPVTGGRGRAVVVATGMETVLGRIAGAVQETERERTPLQRRMSTLSSRLGFAGVGLSLLVFLLGILRGHPLVDMALFAVAVAVSAIPEGLPAVINVTLALGVQRMAERNAIVRRLPAVETLGSTTVICSDKTGTISRNEMTVTRLWTLDGSACVTGDGFRPEGEIESCEQGAPPGAFDELLEIGILANNAKLDEQDGRWAISGSATDGAVLVASRKALPDAEAKRRARPRLAELPFGSAHKYMASLHGARGDDGDGAEILVKGAPDRILPFCTHALVGGEARPLDDGLRERIETANAAFGGEALRVLAGAKGRLAGEPPKRLEREDVEKDLVFVGLWGIVDPPRPEATRAIAAARGAGIRVVMITGDHGVTATAIAEKTGVIDGEGQVLLGHELEVMSDEELDRRVDEVSVYARVSPQHKLRIMQSLKRRGQIVAMTGDGVNDAPALKGADIGIAMGQTGTEVAKEAADLILVDDDFATIVHAVEEGRTIFANLSRVVFFLLATNLGEILTLVGALLLDLPLPLTAIMVLWINLVTDGACTIPLGVEPRHGNVLARPPRPPEAGILDRSMLRRIFVMAPIMATGTLGLFAYELKIGSPLHAQTMAFTVLAAFQWFHALNARSSSSSLFSIGVFTNRWLWGGIGLAVMLQALVTQTALGRSVFGVEALTLHDWLLVSLVAGAILVVDEVLKAIGAYGKS